MGGGALILGYGLDRGTEDIDLLLDDDELRTMVEGADFGLALEATNRELEGDGLYLSHLWGPEQQILTPDWRQSCRPVSGDWGSELLTVSVLGPLDLILSKLCRADEEDLADVHHIIEVEGIDRQTLVDSLASAVVPADFRDVFPEAAKRALVLFDEEREAG